MFRDFARLAMNSRFVIHRHKAGRPHFDLRLVEDDRLRSWSMLKEPPCRDGEQRLAIERECLSPDQIEQAVFKEDAFGEGRVYTWDEGEVRVSNNDPKRLTLVFMGKKLSGNYELRQM